MGHKPQTNRANLGICPPLSLAIHAWIRPLRLSPVAATSLHLTRAAAKVLHAAPPWTALHHHPGRRTRRVEREEGNETRISSTISSSQAPTIPLHSPSIPCYPEPLFETTHSLIGMFNLPKKENRPKEFEGIRSERLERPKTRPS